MMFMGMQDQWYTFTMFDAEAFYVRDYVLGKISLPEKSERDADIKKWHARCINKTTAVEAIEFQRDYVGDLLTVSVNFLNKLFSLAKTLFKYLLR